VCVCVCVWKNKKKWVSLRRILSCEHAWLLGYIKFYSLWTEPTPTPDRGWVAGARWRMPAWTNSNQVWTSVGRFSGAAWKPARFSGRFSGWKPPVLESGENRNENLTGDSDPSENRPFWELQKIKKAENWEGYLLIPFLVFSFRDVGYRYRFRV